MMKPTRRSGPSAYQVRSNSIRLHGRVTKEDIQAACLRRWDGRARITIDWFNLYHEPELCFPDGDLLIYLREPGQSSRGPAFRVHKSLLDERGFHFLLDKCIDRPPIHPGTECLLSACHGCDYHASPSELYIPAPNNVELDAMFDHHVTTRNFFAWLYTLPLAGRSLGRSLIDLKERIDYYRPDNPVRTSLDIIAYAESQRYLDFRECVDHALAALLLAENLQIEDLWVDAFTHCVGMSHRGLNSSVEYWAISYDTKLLIHEAQIEMEARVEGVRESVRDFFENDLSGNFLGLSQIARDHFDHFRSRLHSYHIKQHGFWPPDGFEDDTTEHRIYASMYCDFRNLYHHLVDPESLPGMTDLQLSMSGGVCTTQNIQAFDSRHGYESLPKTLPLLPLEPDVDAKTPGMQRPKSWNPLIRRRMDKDKRKALRTQALIVASNRDWTIMECPLVRWYSEFESQIVIDEFEQISMVDGRKVRWILIYVILQNLISVMQTPAQVRNVDGVTYLLCCRPPKLMPWKKYAPPQRPTLNKRHSVIEPDSQYLHSNTLSNESVINKIARPTSKHEKEKRRQSLPAYFTSVSSRPSTSRSMSIRKFISRQSSLTDDTPQVPKSGGFCEILIQGYGNGLNEVDTTLFNADTIDINTTPDRQTMEAPIPTEITATEKRPRLSIDPGSPSTEKVPGLTPTSTTSVSRESSNASSNRTWSRSNPANHSDSDLIVCVDLPSKLPLGIPDLAHVKLPEISVHEIDNQLLAEELNHILDEEGCLRTAHFNTETWDNLLGLAY